jgi:hypothetical protein
MGYSLVESFGFFEVDDIEAHSSFSAVLYCKIEPLQVAARVCVDAQVEVVLGLAHLHHAVQIAALEVAVEDELAACGEGGVHALEDARVFGPEVGVELAEVGCHVGVVGVEGAFVLEGIAARHFLVQFETAGKPPP